MHIWFEDNLDKGMMDTKKLVKTQEAKQNFERYIMK